MRASKRTSIPETREIRSVVDYHVASPEADKPPRTRKVRITTMIAAEAANLARNAVYWTPALTMSALVEGAIMREVRRLEKERGEPFAQRARELPSGRPYQGQDLTV